MLRHHLAERLPEGALAEAAAACGIQETPHRTAVVALHARVDGVSAPGFERALTEDKGLLVFWAMRGAPYVVPTGEADVFATGALPDGDASWRTFFGGWARSLRDAAASLPRLVDEAAGVAAAVLDGRQLPVDDLRRGVAARMPAIQGLEPPGGAHADLPEPLFRALGLRRVAVVADSRRMTDALVARTDQWLGEPRPAADADPARSRGELLRRFLRCYGPTTPRAFAEWTSRSPGDARAIFEALDGELARVDVDGSAGWLLADDLDVLAGAPPPTGTRLLPPQDPFLQQRDRDRLLPDEAQRRRLWRPVGGPGLVLQDGDPVAVWSAQTRGKALNVTVAPFRRLPAAARERIAGEAGPIAALRGAERADVTFA
jgi:hypothetical protein